MYVIAHDMGTSSDKAVLVDFEGNIIASSKSDYPIYYPYPAWAEQEPEEYWQGVCKSSKDLIAKTKIDPKEVKAVVFTTQAMGIIPVDEKGNALYRNISWVDGRAEKQAQSIMKKFGGPKIFSLFSGTPIMGKDVVAKITWIKEERPDIYRRTKYFLDVNGYLKFRCTGEMVAEFSGASSYGLDLKKNTWLAAIKMLGIEMDKLPPIVASTDHVGNLTKEAAKDMGLVEGIPVFGGCDDVQSACIGSGMTRDGDIHIYLGTSAWVCASSKDKTKFKNGAAAIKSADPSMNLIVGITEAAGSNIEWLLKQFFAREKEEYGDKIYDHMSSLIADIPSGSNGLICTPWMLGERCPVSTTTTRATLFNIDESHTREHLMRSIYEGIGYNLRWILENFHNDYKFDCSTFRVVGGGAQNDAWMQIISDITGTECSTVKNSRNAGALGAAIIALKGLGEINSLQEAEKYVRINKTYYPNPKNFTVYNKMFGSYKDIYYGLEKAYIRANGSKFTRKVGKE